jgi:hypothetical protein
LAGSHVPDFGLGASHVVVVVIGTAVEQLEVVLAEHVVVPMHVEETAHGATTEQPSPHPLTTEPHPLVGSIGSARVEQAAKTAPVATTVSKMSRKLVSIRE